MSWIGIGGSVAGAVVGGVMNNSGGSSSNGGAGTQTQTKEPWLQAQPWIMNNMQQGQNLQSQYQARPFSDQQQQAYQNQANQSAYMRAAVPSLLGQLQSQQVGFDRSNPNARPNAFSFDGLMSAANAGNQAASAQQGQGLLSMLNSTPSSGLLNLNPPPAPAPAPAAAPTFTQHSIDADPGIQAFMRAIGQTPSQGGYGSFKYGDQPAPGTQQYLDMQMYLQAGGNDPRGLYRTYPGNQNGMGAATDDGGAAAAVGSSANF